jgi:hypothetical protein
VLLGFDLIFVVFLTTLLVANTIVCQLLWWLVNNNLKQSVGKKSCSISCILLTQPEKSGVNFLYSESSD